MASLNSAENRMSSQGKQTSEGCFHDLDSLDSSSLSCLESGNTEASLQNSEEEHQYQHTDELDQEILALTSQVKDLQLRELKQEIQYLHCRDQEMMLMELENMLLLEITRVELLNREISSVEAESQWFENMVFEYQEVLKLLRVSRCRNRALHRRVKKLSRKTNGHRQSKKQHCKQIEAKEAEISRTCEELEAKADIIRKLEDEIQEQNAALRQLQVEKDDLTSQIESANKAALSKMEIEKDYSQIVSELEKLEFERAVEIKELIYLRWCNACLRHELMRKNQEQGVLKKHTEQMELKFRQVADFGSDNEHGHSALENGESRFNFPETRQACAHLKGINSLES